VEAYLATWSYAEAARRAGYHHPWEMGHRLAKVPEIDAAIKARLTEATAEANEVLVRLTEHARADIGKFFKVTERWTEHPLPTEEIIKEDPDAIKMTLIGPVKYTNYMVRRIVLDMQALKNPKKSRLVKKFTDSPKNGLGIELHDSQAALVQLGRIHKLFDGLDEKTIADSGAFQLPADVIAPSFLDLYDDIRAHLHTEYVLKGGRGSTKSSFISLALVWLIKNNPTMHAIALRKVANTLRDSVYSQVVWAITELGLEDQFKCTTSPLEITYASTGQKIYFRGADEPGKIKSIKPPFGHIGIAWFEELDQFKGAEGIRNIEQSAIRGGDLAFIFKSFNPPKTAANWANKYVKIPKANQLVHHSTYLDLGSRIRWLGKPWVEEAEHLKQVNPKAYEHEYLGIANGTGGLVFENVQLRKITDEEIAQFDRIHQGVDWGYFPDPWQWGKMHYDAGRRTLFIFDELRLYKKGNDATAKALKDKPEDGGKGIGPNDLIIADSAEPKSVADYRSYGLNCRGAEKGPDSVDYSMKWLQSLVAIVIDPERCPYHADEFLNYELEPDPNEEGAFISEYPDKNNHCIDEVRYAMNNEWRRRGQ